MHCFHRLRTVFAALHLAVPFARLFAALQALRETGTDGVPQDYLQFYTLVNREVQRPDECQSQQRPPSHSFQARPGNP